MPQFKAKARAIDLLGKGQIADLPTAISELWKNGYDAYADKLETYLYLPGYEENKTPLFILSDDGKGMDNEDIVNKWFVLGTDSKSRNEPDVKGEDTLNKPPRTKMGEKGIGRLAVAYLGSQMLMLTKKKNNFLEILFFDWRILENFDLFLDDINIPIRSLESSADLPDIFESLKTEFLQNFLPKPGQKMDPWKDQMQLRDQIIQECKPLSIPTFIIEEQIKPLCDEPTKGHGTKFLIFNPDSQIVDLIEFAKNDENSDTKDDETASHTVSALAALFNKFKSEDIKYSTSFIVLDENGPYDLLSLKSFFSPADFDDCDHLINGTFDNDGHFEGDIRIYNQTVAHKFKVNRPPGKSKYGPLSIKLGYLMGRENETKLNHDQYNAFNEKLDLFGGLYVYRDGFRVLPYGRPENDFLEFEERRNRSAGDWFFSKRRMFGYIEIGRKENPKLNDKSSREGFVNNAAYQEFKGDLMSFFKDLAKKYFATNAEYDYKKVQIEELQQAAETANQEHQRDIQDRKDFAKKLKDLPVQLEQLEKMYFSNIGRLDEFAKNENLSYEEVESLLQSVSDIKLKMQTLVLNKPLRFKPTDNQAKTLHNYRKQYTLVSKKIDESDPTLSKIRKKLKAHELFKEFQSRYQLYSNTLRNDFVSFEVRLNDVLNKMKNELDGEKILFVSEFDNNYNSIVPQNINQEEIQRSLKLMESVFNDTRRKASDRIIPYLEHLDKVNFDVKEDDLVGYYKIQFEEMKDEWNKTYELAQLGIAVEVIDHQFNTLYSQLSENINSFQDYLAQNKEAQKKYKLLQNAFQHLEDNYKLLQPLYRTTARIRKDVTGEELFEYAQDFFKTRLDENSIKFDISTSGKAWTEFTFESIFKPVIINIINNAIYWLLSETERYIKIDAKGDKLLILNSGPEINDTILDKIFDLFYSERPKGRGIGLYLAKRSLNGVGFSISASNDTKYNQLKGACFIIEKINKK